MTQPGPRTAPQPHLIASASIFTQLPDRKSLHLQGVLVYSDGRVTSYSNSLPHQGELRQKEVLQKLPSFLLRQLTPQKVSENTTHSKEGHHCVGAQGIVFGFYTHTAEIREILNIEDSVEQCSKVQPLVRDWSEVESILEALLTQSVAEI